MTPDEIDDAICTIMMKDGPDRHVDGHEVLTAFVLALLGGRADEWLAAYKSRS